MVILNPDHELEKIIETAGSEWLESSVERAVGG